MRDNRHSGESLRVHRGPHGRCRYRGLHGLYEVSGSADASKLVWQRQHGVHHQWTRPIRFDGMRAVSHAYVDDRLFLDGRSEQQTCKSLLRPGCASHGFEPCRRSHAGLSRWGRVPHGTALGPGATPVFPARRPHFRLVARNWRAFHGLRPARRFAGRLRDVGGGTGDRKVSCTDSVAEARPPELPSLVVNASAGGGVPACLRRAAPPQEGGHDRAEHWERGQSVFPFVKCEFSRLGLEVEGGPQAAVHVKGDGGVLVDDAPGAAIAMQANSCAHPEADGPTGGLGSSAHPVKAVAEGKVAAHGDRYIARLIIDWPFPSVEPRLLFLEVRSTMGKRL